MAYETIQSNKSFGVFVIIISILSCACSLINVFMELKQNKADYVEMSQQQGGDDWEYGGNKITDTIKEYLNIRTAKIGMNAAIAISSIITFFGGIFITGAFG